MKEGAFAFLDCLGFKGVWRNPEVRMDEVVHFLTEAKKHVDNLPTIKAFQNAKNIEHSVVFVSDSIAISARYKFPPSNPDVDNGLLILITVLISIDLCKRYAAGPLPLMFRGNITFGSHIAEDVFLLGEAVDDAVTMAETTQGAYIWLSPKAKSLCRKWLNYYHTSMAESQLNLKETIAVQNMNRLFSINQELEDSAMLPEEAKKNRDWWSNLNENQKASVAREWLYQIVLNSNRDELLPDYPMEMKNGGHLCADVVNPLSDMHPEKHSAWVKTVLSRFSDLPIDVLMKKQNTARFLRFASEHTTSEFNRKMVLMEENRSWLSSATGVPFR